MVIECPACKTKFKLPDEKVGPAGVSVRCSKCATTFAVRPPAAVADKTVVSVPTIPEETRVSASPPAAAPAPPPDFAATVAGFPAPPSQPQPQPPPAPMPDPFSAQPPQPDPFGANAASGFSSPPATPPPPSGGAAAPGFGGMSSAFASGMAATGGDSLAAPPPPLAGFGTPFVGLEMPGLAPAVPPPVDDPSTLSNESENSDTQPGVDAGLRAALLGANAPGSTLTEEGDAGMVRNPAAGPASFDFGDDPFSAGASSGSQPAPPPADLFARPAPPAPKAPPAPAPSIGLAAPEKKPAPEKKAALKKPVQRLTTPGVIRPVEPARAYRLLLALFFLGAFASAFASLTEGTFDPKRLDRGRLSLLIGPPTVAEGIQGLAITARRGGYVTTPAGKPRVYTAHGVAINESAAPKGYLEVRGRILDADGGVLAETTAPCGNAFRDDQLLGFHSSDELRRAYLPAGDGFSNAKVAPGAAVACTVVFFEAPSPEKTAAFELEIVSAQPVS